MELRHVVWVCPGSLWHSLDSATWVETTRELCQLGWHVTLVSAGQPGQHPFEGVELLCFPTTSTYILRQVVYHLKLLGYLVRSRREIDVVLFHQMSAPWLLPLRIVRYLSDEKRPLLVMDTRTVPMEVQGQATARDRLRGAYYRLMNNLGDHFADGQTAITRRMAELVHIPDERLWGIWPSGAVLERFAPAQSQRHWPVEEEPVRLIYVGALHYERNLMAMCRAVEKANAEGLHFVLWLVGDGAERADLEAFALQANGQVRVVLSVPHQQVPSLLAQAHVGVLPFPDEEQFRVSSPIKLFEYMAAGLPILATRIVCHTDVVGSGGYAFWAKDASVDGLLEGLRCAWDARESLGVMGREAAEVATAWTWRESAKKLGAALEVGLQRAGKE